MDVEELDERIEKKLKGMKKSVQKYLTSDIPELSKLMGERKSKILEKTSKKLGVGSIDYQLITLELQKCEKLLGVTKEEGGKDALGLYKTVGNAWEVLKKVEGEWELSKEYYKTYEEKEVEGSKNDE